ncbi:MAG: AI-2E family transporter [bacterium]|nr:AI-2E family transporter [bacterium]
MLETNKKQNFYLAIIASGIVIGFLYYAQSILIPLVIAIFVAYLLYPLAEFLDRLKIPTWLNIIIIVLLTVLIILTFGYILYKQSELFVRDWPMYRERLTELIETGWYRLQTVFQSSQTTGTEYKPMPQPKLPKFISEEELVKLLSKVVLPLSSLVSTLILILIIAYFIVYTRHSLHSKLEMLLGKEKSDRAIQMAKDVSIAVQNYILGRAIIMVILILLTTVGLWLIGVKYAFLWGIVVAVLNWIPLVGVIIATLMPTLVALVQFPTILPAIWVVILYTVIQLFENMILSPILLGEKVNLSPLVVLIAFMFWSWLWGVMGAILAIPITATMKVICDRIDSLKPLGIILGSGIPPKSNSKAIADDYSQKLEKSER